MADDNPIQKSGEGIAAQAKAILTRPKQEWPRIAGRDTGWKQAFITYALPLAAIGPICNLIGGQIFGYGGYGIYYSPALMAAITTAISTYVLNICALFIVAFLANFISQKFGGKDDWNRAFKLVTYSMTAAWLAAIFGLVPFLSILTILGLWSIYLFYTGATPMMGVPHDRAGGYTLVTILAAIAVNIIFAALAGVFVASGFIAGGTMMGHGYMAHGY
ncbi:hypothetical protein FHS61_002230 [Altererythrobacter atlanticus]|uniref:Yip1 domain protein n=1 Tax=Croceibacterium atlanticum TaxID=1267766 RepID=A0A0F7KRJ2_9SPHN|nr:Yip1 family protein [Croceibacterium atlanticum]AKH41741.1 Yip1 domain protein [Croceibacterium atlanticum]MBB5733204.1 hypothetical protein [Croceibacterium atlanticum]